jgi:hypothetical protein
MNGEQAIHAFLQDQPHWVNGHGYYRQLTLGPEPDICLSTAARHERVLSFGGEE